MRKSGCFIAVCCVLILTAIGCNRDQSGADEWSAAAGGQAIGNAGRVAIIDLDAVAKRFGCDKQMSDSIQQREATLEKQLAAIQSSYARQIAEKKKEFGDAPTAEQEKMLAAIQRQAAASLNKVRQQAKLNLNQHGSLLIQGFRKQLQPIARRVAREKGLSIIVTKNDSVIFDYDTTVDITADVIEQLLAIQSQPASAGGPAEAAAAEEQTAEQPSPRQSDQSEPATAARGESQVR